MAPGPLWCAVVVVSAMLPVRSLPPPVPRQIACCSHQCGRNEPAPAPWNSPHVLPQWHVIVEACCMDGTLAPGPLLADSTNGPTCCDCSLKILFT
jgi:hypothetical protein